MRAKPVTVPKRPRKKDPKIRAHEMAKARFFWLELHARYQQARSHGIPHQEIRRRLEAREAAEAADPKKAQRAR
jgi:hypothetical protein